MSDALTNSEIEDVLTSIRRLVAQEDRRAEAGRSGGVHPEGGRLILTQAQRIDRAAGSEGAVQAAMTHAPREGVPDLPRIVPAAPATVALAANIPAPDTTPDAADLLPAPDLRGLEATIAELEAAVSASGSVFEPDGTEAAQGTGSNVTALYATPSFAHNAAAEAKGAKPALSAAQPPQDEAAARATPEPARTAGDEDADDDLFETIIDEATLRILVAQIVREELHGQLGERITLQVRKLVRSEIARVLDSKNLI